MASHVIQIPLAIAPSAHFIPQQISSDLSRILEQMQEISSCLHCLSAPRLNRLQLKGTIECLFNNEGFGAIQSLALYGNAEPGLSSKEELDALMGKIAEVADEIGELLKNFPYDSELTFQELAMLQGQWAKISEILGTIRAGSQVTRRDLDSLYALILQLPPLFTDIADLSPEKKLSAKIEEFLDILLSFEKTGKQITIVKKRKLLLQIALLFERCKEVQSHDPMEQQLSPLSAMKQRLTTASKKIQGISTRF